MKWNLELCCCLAISEVLGASERSWVGFSYLKSPRMVAHDTRQRCNRRYIVEKAWFIVVFKLTLDTTKVKQNLFC